MLRHCCQSEINVWLVTDKPYAISCQLRHITTNTSLFDDTLSGSQLQQICIGKHAYINLIQLTFAQPLPENERISYDLSFSHGNESIGLTECVDGLTYPEQPLPNFVIKSKADHLLHGSCRKPHFSGGDGLSQVDQQLASVQRNHQSLNDYPALLMMSGDQIYVDDVAGPTLNAIHQVIKLLALHDENLPHTQTNENTMANGQQLYQSESCFYQRHNILPHRYINQGFFGKRFSVKKQEIFTSVNAKNHLITAAEVFAMYLLVWSPSLWRLVDLKNTSAIAAANLAHYQQELKTIDAFALELPNIRRALAHIPTYMIFDDHDVTDDWNLTRGWEEAAYGHELSKRIIGNALIGYYYCQGWGNAPQNFADVADEINQHFGNNEINEHGRLVEQLLDFDQWHYHLNTSPKIVVLDTRTQRWRSESNANKPSGLMDWESLCELQQELMNEESVIMVSAAPIYGVKFIEAVQRVATFFGKPLAVDAENWMAHSGTANVILNIFRHHKTPPNFIILSGDVHYSFVYEVHHRFIRTQSRIIQITCSGIKNQFPDKLLQCLDFFNRYLYGSYSPLNWFTKRRRMKIKVRKPNNDQAGHLYNGSGIGRLILSDNNKNVKAELLCVTGDIIEFQPPKKPTDQAID